MGAPKIKVYQLPRGYTEDGDNDVQQITNDELVPVVDKPLAPEDFRSLTGVKWKTMEELLPINYEAGQISSALLPHASGYQAPVSGDIDIFISGEEAFQPVVIAEDLQIVPSGDYTLSPSGIYFTGTPPSGATLQYWRDGSIPTKYWVGRNDDWYIGNNKAFIVTIYDTNEDIVDQDDYTIMAGSGLVTMDSAVSGVYADYTYEQAVTRYYIGQRENWIDGHLYMNVDVFKGTEDYPGDDSEDPLGNPIVQGAIPKFVEDSEYQINFRNGMVTFPEEFDSDTYPVKASFSYLVNVHNVTGQTLDQVAAASGSYQYRAVSDKKFPGSIGARWIARDDEYTPRNFYVDGELKPQLITISPYDTLTIKNEP